MNVRYEVFDDWWPVMRQFCDGNQRKVHVGHPHIMEAADRYAVRGAREASVAGEGDGWVTRQAAVLRRVRRVPANAAGAAARALCDASVAARRIEPETGSCVSSAHTHTQLMWVVIALARPAGPPSRVLQVRVDRAELPAAIIPLHDSATIRTLLSAREDNCRCKLQLLLLVALDVQQAPLCRCEAPALANLQHAPHTRRRGWRERHRSFMTNKPRDFAGTPRAGPYLGEGVTPQPRQR